ncbi:GGDEF domain-containing protein [Hyphococcus sp.]|uniref:GGDEF domain-containing protein n=1 Tax=Hyphococcus sp. TaxID=2038636 RepID=UPI0035C687F8
MQEDIGAAPKARIVYVGGEDEARSALTVAFEDAGYALVSHEDAGRMDADIGLIDLRGRHVSSRKAQSIAGLLRKSSPESSILIIIDPYIDETARCALRRHGELVVMLTKPDGLIERCRQVLRLRNIAEEAGERLKSLAGLNRLNDFPPISAPAGALRVLIAGEAGPVALSALNALKPITEQSVCVFSAGQALRAVENMRFDAAIFLPKRDSDPLMSLARSLRRHPKHANMPIVFPLHDPDDAAEYAIRGASDFMLTGHIGADLAPKAQLAARRARLQKSMRKFLQACEGDGVRDAGSGAFTATFLAEHGARLCARADQTGRTMSMVTLRIETESKEHGEAEPGRRALHQAARLINRVTRAEDMVARVATNTFLVMMPATTERNAEKAALRIQGVLENTVFRSAGDDLLYGVNVNAVACRRPEGLCIEECVALGFALLRENTEVAVSNAP